jgi:two-component system, sporulation sensor kinase D
MDIYARKTNFKLLIFVSALLIGVATVAYTNYLANRISIEEKQKATLWAEAIEKRAKMINYTYDLFNKLATDERQKVNVWAQSTKFILTVEDNETLTFFNDIVTSNDNIPVLLVNESGTIVSSRNLDESDSLYRQNAVPTDDELRRFSTYPPIIIQYRNIPGFGRNFIYYRDSKLFQELKVTLNEFVEKFIADVVVNTTSAPVILTDGFGRIEAYGNIDSNRINSNEKVMKLLAQMRKQHEPIIFELGLNQKKYIYFDESLLIKQLRWFPYIQLGIFAAFILLSYLAFSSARKAEQNLVWVGMAKETAHQLGTPISSLAAWVEYMRETGMAKENEAILNEIDADINRLSLVADRFSKIGAAPKLTPESVNSIIERNIAYMRTRISDKVLIRYSIVDGDYKVAINQHLFDWVIENLLKNAIDAMNGEGSIDISTSKSGKLISIDFKDTGCGIPKNKFNTIFEPGYSTKRRGWGLGLSLTKRIVESYHNGKIYVKESSIGSGTTIRIELTSA